MSDDAYTERNRLVALLAAMFPSTVTKTAIEGWDPEWHNCVYIEFPWGQASWHFHDREAHLFDFLKKGPAEWDGHTTEEKYRMIDIGARGLQLNKLFKDARDEQVK